MIYISPFDIGHHRTNFGVELADNNQGVSILLVAVIGKHSC